MRSICSTFIAAAIANFALPAAAATQAKNLASTFAEPVRIRAGEALLGEKRLFPSPVWQDMNGDGLADLVVGDLFGRLTVALRNSDSGPATYAAETKLAAADGKDIAFHNW